MMREKFHGVRCYQHHMNPSQRATYPSLHTWLLSTSTLQPSRVKHGKHYRIYEKVMQP